MIRTRWFARTGIALLPALLAGCGGLPQPFAGNPGATGRRLVQPPPSRLLVLPATDALLPDSGVKGFPEAVATALEDRGVPAFPAYPHKNEWRLTITADLDADQVTPRFSVQNPQDKPQGAVQGPPVSADQWQSATPALLQSEAEAAAPAIAGLLDKLEVAREESDPNSLLNRPAQVAITGVAGAPGDGDASLAHEVALHLSAGGIVLQPKPQGADFTVRCEVRSVPEGKDVTRIELQWIITDSQGREAGRVVQINEVPATAISGLWGDVAIAAGTEAAGGIRDVIDKQLRAPRNPAGKRPVAPPPAA